MSITLNDFTSKVKQYEAQGVKIQVDALPDGRIVFKTDNPQITDELTRKYAVRINDSLGAFTNLIGAKDSSSAANKFYQNFSSFFGATQHPTPQESSGTIK